MESFQQILIISLYFLCPVLIGLILLQGGAGDVSSSFGGGGQLDSALGVGANRKMAKLTTFLVILFMGMVLIAAIPLETGLGGNSSVEPAKLEGTDDVGGATVPADDAMVPKADAVKPDGDAVKPEGDAVKPEGDAVKPEGDAPPKPEVGIEVESEPAPEPAPEPAAE